MTDTYRICCLEGDGISAELIASSVAVLDALAPYFTQPVELTHHQVGFASLDMHGTTITEEVIAA
ncbi:MAG: 3-isopropylmalate dehydrogenase, partial [Candidatus Puniceispirillaceae bacterium]